MAIDQRRYRFVRHGLLIGVSQIEDPGQFTDVKVHIVLLPCCLP